MFPPQAWGTVIASCAAIVFAYACPQDLRNTAALAVWVAWTAVMVRMFLFHLGLLLVLVAGAAALTRRWRLLAATGPLLLFTLGPAAWSYAPRKRPLAAGETITVMTVNLLHANQNAPALAAEYPHARYVRRADSFGLAIYSRRPFIGPVDPTLPLGNAGTPQIRAVVEIADCDVAFYNIHTLPPRNLAFTTEQRLEIADLLNLLKREKLPVVLCGDFNFTGASPYADELRRLGLRDVHRLSGRGRGATWPVLSFFRALPGIRLDHIYLSKELTSPSSHTGVGRGSDHRPIIADIGFVASPIGGGHEMPTSERAASEVE